MKAKTILLTLMALVLLAVPMVVSAQEGEIINSDITRLGEAFTVDASTTVNGDVVVVGAPATINGTINGNLVVMGSSAYLGEAAVVTGDCVILGGSLSGASPAACQTVLDQAALISQLEAAANNFQWDVPAVPAVPDVPAVPAIPAVPPVPGVPTDGHWENDQWVPAAPAADHGHGENSPSDWEDNWDNNHEPSTFGRISAAAGQALFMGLLAFGVATYLPSQLQVVQATARRKPAASGAVGFVSSIALSIIIGIIGLLTALLIWVCIGIVGIPVLMALGLGVAAASLLGWVAMGTTFGEWLVRRFNLKAETLAAKAAVGTMALTFSLGILAIVPLVPEGLVRWILMLIGLGAVVLTQFGRVAYPNSGEPTANSSKIDIVLQTMPEDLK